MADMPRTIKVGPYVYTVSTDESSLRRLEHEMKEAHAGHTSHHNLSIQIDPNHIAGYQRDTLWHEVLHCVAGVVNLQTELNEEAIIGSLSGMTLAVLRDNPDLVAYLTAPD